MIRTRLLEHNDWQKADDFVKAHPDGTFFHLTGWIQVMQRAFGHACPWIVAEENGSIVGLLPLTHVKSRLFTTALISNGFSVYGGPLALSNEAHAALDAAVAELLSSTGAQYVEYRSRQRTRPDWAAKDETYVTFRKDIDPDADTNMLAIPRKQRAMVRKAFKFELSYNLSRDVDTFFTLYATSVRNLGTPVFPKKLFKALLDVFEGAVDVLTVQAPDGTPLTSVLSFYYQNEVLPYYGGGTAAARLYAANDYMYWALMDSARERGCRIFDFGRSKVGTGAYSFKKNWGFEPQPLVYEYLLADGETLPDVNPNNPKYRLLVNSWQKLPLPVANFLGPFISRSLA